MAFVIIDNPGFLTSTVRCGNGNLAGANFATVSGGRTNTANQVYSTVAGGSCNITTSAYSSISGGFKNRIVSCFGSSIGGGVSNTASCYSSFIGAGRCNTVFGNQGVITGGDTNKITNSAIGSFIGSGQVNLINGGGRSAILGGSCNTVTNLFSNVLGGCKNTITSQFGTVLGGTNNTVTAACSSVLAGSNIVATTPNTAYVPQLNIKNVGTTTAIKTLGVDANGFVVESVGGSGTSVTGLNYNNTSGVLTLSNSDGSNLFASGFLTSNQQVMVPGVGLCSVQKSGNNFAYSEYSAIGGGVFNTTNIGNYQTIGGGQCNIATGNFDTIGGGYLNKSSCFTSVIGGGLRNTTSVISGTIGGGTNNTIGLLGTVSGYYNVITTPGSTISGYYYNVQPEFTTSGLGTGAKFDLGFNTGSFYFGTVTQTGQGYVNGDTLFFPGNCFGGTAGVDDVTIQITTTDQGILSTIGGGECNTNFSCFGTIGGGRFNKTIIGSEFGNISNNSQTISGGYCNLTAFDSSTVGGGRQNTAFGYNNTVSGGFGNKICSGQSNFIGGGQSNTITSNTNSSAILGGTLNTLFCDNSYIIGTNISSDRQCTTFVNNLSIKNIPTSPTSPVVLPSGSVWRDGTTLKIVI